MQVSWVVTWVDNNYDIVQIEYTCVHDGVTYTQKTNGVVGNNSIDTVALENFQSDLIDNKSVQVKNMSVFDCLAQFFKMLNELYSVIARCACGN